eukprot:1233919-Rhodomonas_salina.3
MCIRDRRRPLRLSELSEDSRDSLSRLPTTRTTSPSSEQQALTRSLAGRLGDDGHLEVEAGELEDGNEHLRVREAAHDVAERDRLLQARAQVHAVLARPGLPPDLDVVRRFQHIPAPESGPCQGGSGPRLSRECTWPWSWR